MVLLRDVDAAHLISLGGWLRAFQIGCVASLEPYDPEKAKVLGRVDIAEYFIESLGTLEPRVQELAHVQEISEGLSELRDMLDVPESKSFSLDEVRKMRGQIDRLVALSTGAQESPPAPAAASAAATTTAPPSPVAGQ